MKQDIEYAIEMRNITRKWIEERISRQKAKIKTDDLNLDNRLKQYYNEYEQIIEDLKK